MNTTYDARQQAAYQLGADAAHAAASWAIDGNTSPEHIARMVAMFDAGDPALWDYLPARPDLSGEWADSETPASLYASVTGLDASDADPEDISYLADAWEAGVSEAFGTECERIIRAAASDEADETEAEGVSISDVDHWTAESQALDRIEAAAQEGSAADLAAVVYEELGKLPGRKAPR